MPAKKFGSSLICVDRFAFFESQGEEDEIQKAAKGDPFMSVMEQEQSALFTLVYQTLSTQPSSRMKYEIFGGFVVGAKMFSITQTS